MLMDMEIKCLHHNNNVEEQTTTTEAKKNKIEAWKIVFFDKGYWGTVGEKER